MAKFAKLISLLICFGFLTGCSTVEIPGYIKAENPYKRSFDANYAAVLKASLDALVEKGWTVKEQSLPSVYEESYARYNPNVKQTLIITEVKKTSFFVGTNYARMNVLLSSSSLEKTDVEIRYVKVRSYPFKSFYSYRKEKLVNQVFSALAELLKSPQPPSM